MKKILISAIAAAVFSLPSVSQAACRITEGTVINTAVNAATDNATFVIRAFSVAFKTEPAKIYVFSTANAKILDLMLSAQASNGRVQVSGAGSDECTDFSLGDSNNDNKLSGGAIISASVSR